MRQCFATKTPVAAKPQQCYWCGGEIQTGERHVAWGWAEDGRVSTVRCHDDCKTAWDFGFLNLDHWFYAEEVGFGDHRRGCCCERGRDECECGMAAAKETK